MPAGARAFRGAGNCALNPRRPAAEHIRAAGDPGRSPGLRGAGNCALNPHRPTAEHIRAAGDPGRSPGLRGAGNCATRPHRPADAEPCPLRTVPVAHPSPRRPKLTHNPEPILPTPASWEACNVKAKAAAAP
jgi:hypothetical protein